MQKGLLFLLCVVILVSGCRGDKTYISFGGKEAGQPVFCISAKPNCAKPTAPLRKLVVELLDENGKPVRTVWATEAPNNWRGYKTDKITYGRAPVGWITRSRAEALKAGETYRVNGQYHFTITANGLIQSA